MSARKKAAAKKKLKITQVRSQIGSLPSRPLTARPVCCHSARICSAGALRRKAVRCA